VKPNDGKEFNCQVCKIRRKSKSAWGSLEGGKKEKDLRRTWGDTGVRGRGETNIFARENTALQAIGV